MPDVVLNLEKIQQMKKSVIWNSEIGLKMEMAVTVKISLFFYFKYDLKL